MDSRFYINSGRIEGPLNITPEEPLPGSFAPSSGPPVYFANRWVSGNAIRNSMETVVWAYANSGSAIYNTLKALTRGQVINFSGFYGPHLTSGDLYQAEILDVNFKLDEGFTFRNHETSYTVTVKWNRV